ncbi:MAG: right-handed parallel beta-helix repeat-containing protein [Capsulimonadales bacterium]|nr:right-handed parallel beta-helix repeat-containing protein [Capsulimonadales bacterium]
MPIPNLRSLFGFPSSTALLLASLLLCAVSASAGTLYVAPDGDDSRNAFTAGDPATPLRTIRRALDLARSGEEYGTGDTIVLRGGLYPGPFGLNKSGITLRGYPGERPILQVTDPNAWEVIGIPAMDRWDDERKTGVFSPVHHVQVIGLIVDGSLASAECNGIVLHPTAHHVRILDCTVRNMGGAGIAAVGTVSDATQEVTEGSDYVTINGNAVYRCAWGSKYDQSGITLLGLRNRQESDRGYHNVVVGNRIYENRSRYTPPSRTGNGFHTDGNGIIIDTSYESPRTLIGNNLVYRNGGRGIHVFKSNNVDVVNNTCVRNLQDGDLRVPFPNGSGPSAELSVGQSARVRFLNNIAVSGGQPGALCARSFDNGKAVAPAPDSVRFEANLFFGGEADLGTGADKAASWQNRFGNPQFLSPDADSPDFRCRPSGPGVDVGSRRVLLKTDFGSKNRTQGRGPDIGAWETRRP